MLEVRNITKRFGNLVAVKDVSMSVKTGELRAIIGTDGILDGKAAVFKKINPANSRYIAFITGPSRTADIERVLTIGVHGPKRLVIVFVDELGGVNQ